MTTLQPPMPIASNDADFAALVRAFTESTERLEQTHLTLQAEVSRLQGELAEANARLRRSEALAALGEMAAGIAHEIRNPLASIMLYAQALHEDCAEEPERAELCARIDSAVGGLDAIVRDVLTFSRDMRPQVTPVRVGDVIESSILDCTALLAEGDVDVVRNEDDAVVLADEQLLRQALTNVIRNAVEAMVEADAPARRLELDVVERDARRADGSAAACLAVVVLDSGPGIDDDVLERMFNPFFTTRATGTGLGLAIVNRIIEAHGGEVCVRRHPAGGTEVKLCLFPGGDAKGGVI